MRVLPSPLLASPDQDGPRLEQPVVVLLAGLDTATASVVRQAVGVLVGATTRLVDDVLVVEGVELDPVLQQVSLLVPYERARAVRAVVLPSGPLGTSAVARAMTSGSLADLVAERGGALAPVMERGRWSSAYQPVVDLADGTAHGHEALLRVVLDGVVLDSSALFAGAGSEDLRDGLDARAVVAAVSGAAERLGEGRLFVNTSASDADALGRVIVLLERTARYSGLPLSQVVLEITERRRIADEDGFAAALHDVRDRGLLVALDDMGSGYSSLSWFAALTPDYVKVDGGLVRRLPSVGATAVVRGLVDVAHRAGALVVAEHVETGEQADALRELGVDLGQGHVLGRPREL